MAEKRRPQDIGADSPASEEAKEQRVSGKRSAPRGEQPRPGPESRKQPPQGSGRTPKNAGPTRQVRKRFEEGERPSEQGEGEASPERLKQRSSQQGIGAKSGSRSARGERGVDEATRD